MTYGRVVPQFEAKQFIPGKDGTGIEIAEWLHGSTYTMVAGRYGLREEKLIVDHDKEVSPFSYVVVQTTGGDQGRISLYDSWTFSREFLAVQDLTPGADGVD